MRYPLHITTDMLKHQLRQAMKGNERYPFVMMLEPLWTCNLACIGCSTERHTGKLADRVPVDVCLRAADDCGAPSVSICGGEPTVYPELPELIDGLIERKRHIYLCTNALLLDKRFFGKVDPHKRLTVNVHLDGMRKTHDYVVDREGVFDKAVEMIQESKRLGYHTIVNSTVYKETDVDELEELCRYLTSLDIDGILISPGYHYETVERDIFLTNEEIEEKFKRIVEFAPNFKVVSTPLFLEFAAGYRDYQCSPWSTVTFTPRGWKGPCYLIQKNFTWDWDEFWNETDWEYWESRQDDLCQNCKMHSGFEASTVMESSNAPRDLMRLARWQLAG